MNHLRAVEFANQTRPWGAVCDPRPALYRSRWMACPLL